MMQAMVKDVGTVSGKVIATVFFSFAIFLTWLVVSVLLISEAEFGETWNNNLAWALVVVVSLAAVAAFGWLLSTIWRPGPRARTVLSLPADLALRFGLSPEERSALKRQATHTGIYAVTAFRMGRRYIVGPAGAKVWGSPEASVPHAAELEAGTEVTATASHLTLLRVGQGPDFELWVEESGVVRD